MPANCLCGCWKFHLESSCRDPIQGFLIPRLLKLVPCYFYLLLLGEASHMFKVKCGNEYSALLLKVFAGRKASFLHSSEKEFQYFLPGSILTSRVTFCSLSVSREQPSPFGKVLHRQLCQIHLKIRAYFPPIGFIYTMHNDNKKMEDN